jgi:hypothetical protein
MYKKRDTATRRRASPRDNKEKKSSRAKYTCPSELAELISLVRFIPPLEELPSWESVKLGKQVELRTRSNDFFDLETHGRRLMKMTFEECFKYFPSEVRRRLIQSRRLSGWAHYQTEEEIHTLRDMVMFWYPGFVEFRKNLQQIAKYFAYRRERGSITLGMEYREDIEKPRPKKPLIAVSIVSETSDLLGVNPDQFSRSLIGLPGDRIRICEVCGHVFWAFRLDSQTCSRQCSDVRRQRIRRSASPEEKLRINEQRKANRERNKELSLMRSQNRDKHNP